MRFFTRSEGLAWHKANSRPAPDARVLDWGYFHELAYRVPPDAGRKTALARHLTALSRGETAECVLWITGYGIWPSSENQNLFYAVRGWLGESRNLREVPCHLFGQEDLDALECLLDLILYFSWDAFLLLASGTSIVRLSHDEILTVHATDTSTSSQLQEVFRSLDLAQV